MGPARQGEITTIPSHESTGNRAGVGSEFVLLKWTQPDSCCGRHRPVRVCHPMDWRGGGLPQRQEQQQAGLVRPCCCIRLFGVMPTPESVAEFNELCGSVRASGPNVYALSTTTKEAKSAVQKMGTVNKKGENTGRGAWRAIRHFVRSPVHCLPTNPDSPDRDALTPPLMTRVTAVMENCPPALVGQRPLPRLSFSVPRSDPR
jgi:hypothetical protein